MTSKAMFQQMQVKYDPSIHGPGSSETDTRPRRTWASSVNSPWIPQRRTSGAHLFQNRDACGSCSVLGAFHLRVWPFQAPSRSEKMDRVHLNNDRGTIKEYYAVR